MIEDEFVRGDRLLEAGGQPCPDPYPFPAPTPTPTLSRYSPGWLTHLCKPISAPSHAPWMSKKGPWHL